ncbi:MAG: hypothetical protein QG608_1927 [Actinomycetota bacterium]|nr:hypothetical protein [Actinomycetota bacterium]
MSSSFNTTPGAGSGPGDLRQSTGSPPGAQGDPVRSSGPPTAVRGEMSRLPSVAQNLPGNRQRLPRPPRRRRPGVAALAVLLAVGGAAAAGLLAVRIDERRPVLIAAHTIAPGQKITRGDLAVTRVSAEGADLIPAGDIDEIVGRYAAQEIPSRRLIDTRMIALKGLLQRGNAAVGIALKAGRAPASGLRSGDVVQLVSVGQDGVGAILAESAIVSSVAEKSSGSFGSSGDPVATVVVKASQAPAVASAAAADKVAVVLLERGSTEDDE